MRCVLVAAAVLFAAPAFAQEEPGGDPAVSPDVLDEQPEAQPASVQQDAAREVLRGFYVEARIGGGYALSDAVVDDPAYPTVSGRERLGAGSTVQLTAGFDLSDFIALEALVGGAMLSTRRTNRVRDVGFGYGGVGLRVGFDLTERWRAKVSAAAAMVHSDPGVEDAETGAGALVGAGIEYATRIRHFSLGLDALLLAAFSPSRSMLSIGPQLKYTF